MFKRFITGRWYVVIAPPSLYITRFMTWREAKRFIAQFEAAHLVAPHRIIRDISGAFTKRYVKKSYPITNIF